MEKHETSLTGGVWKKSMVPFDLSANEEISDPALTAISTIGSSIVVFRCFGDCTVVTFGCNISPNDTKPGLTIEFVSSTSDVDGLELFEENVFINQLDFVSVSDDLLVAMTFFRMTNEV